MNNISCPCGSKRSYPECCGLFIEKKQLPKTAEELMRSRYTAFTQANMDYIKDTMQGAAAASSDMNSTKTWAEQLSWQGLEVLKHESNFNAEHRALVEFKARYRFRDEDKEIHERSLFECINGRWFYVGEAPHRASIHLGRNDPCHCGSGKKYKKCCL